jgi:hypothetical protein
MNPGGYKNNVGRGERWVAPVLEIGQEGAVLGRVSCRWGLSFRDGTCPDSNISSC